MTSQIKFNLNSKTIKNVLVYCVMEFSEDGQIIIYTEETIVHADSLFTCPCHLTFL